MREIRGMHTPGAPQTLNRACPSGTPQLPPLGHPRPDGASRDTWGELIWGSAKGLHYDNALLGASEEGPAEWVADRENITGRAGQRATEATSEFKAIHGAGVFRPLCHRLCAKTTWHLLPGLPTWPQHRTRSPRIRGGGFEAGEIPGYVETGVGRDAQTQEHRCETQSQGLRERASTPRRSPNHKVPELGPARARQGQGWEWSRRASWRRGLALDLQMGRIWIEGGALECCERALKHGGGGEGVTHSPGAAESGRSGQEGRLTGHEHQAKTLEPYSRPSGAPSEMCARGT